MRNYTALELIRPVVVEMMSVDVGEDDDDDELHWHETGGVMVKTGLMSPESPNTRFQTRIL